MENLFNSPMMAKLQDFGQKLGSNKFLAALQSAMMGVMAAIMVGAISQIVCSVGSEQMLGLFKTGDTIYNLIYLPYQYTMNLLSLWVVALFAYNYAKNLKMKSPIMNAVDALICFLIVAGGLTVVENPAALGGMSTAIMMDYLGATGMFVGFIVVFFSVRLEKFCVDHNIRIKMPDVVPQFLQDSFSAILPLFISLVIILGVSVAVSTTTGGQYTIPSGFMALLSAPLSALTSVPGMFLIGIFATLLWCFGIHGTMIVVPIIMPLSIQAAVANATAYAAGGIDALQFYPVALFSALAMVGGTGNTLPLAIFGLRSKSKQISAVAKISLIPGWFGINEPLTFGMPIMYNPILCIPYVLNVPVIMILTWMGYKFGLLIPAFIPISALLPMGFGRYLGSLSWVNFIWDYIMIIPAALIYLPFFKVYEKQLIKQEAEAEALEAQEAV